MLEQLRALPPEAARAAGKSVAERVLALPEVQAAERVALYAALPDELPTRPLFEALGTAGKVRLLPRVRGEELEFRRVDSWGALRRAGLGVLEPPPEAAALALTAGDVVLVPGVAFDAAGNRLGRGRGYYDRAFAESGGAPLRVGLAYALQRVERVPCDSRDRRVDAIVTERGLHRVEERA